ncbi:IS3 family transposase [Pseudomonas sp. NyZ201]|uniref:IS3 family transposase n=1 Tax=Pseudomonas sp. NyZ201 TaxID=3409857 RepID=UPI003CECD4EE
MTKYSKQFKLSAIEAFLKRGRGFRHVANQFQIDPTLLRRWVVAYQQHGRSSLEHRHQRHSAEFKITVLHRMLNDRLSQRAAAALFNLGNSSQLGRWLRQYYSDGLANQLSVEKSSTRTMPKPSAKSSKPAAVRNEDLSPKELLEKVRMLEAENAYPKKARGVRGGEAQADPGSKEKAQLITALRRQFRLKYLLIAAGLPRSTYYTYFGDEGAEDKYAPLKQAMRGIQEHHRGRYGYRRMTAALRQKGHVINGKKVRRLMGELDLKCTVRPKKYKSYRVLMDEASPNTMNREFAADQPNQKWVTDVTEFKVAGEKLYLSPVLDLYNGEIVAYQTDTRPRYTLVGTMLERALEKLPADSKPMLHSDQGWHYRYPDYRQRLKEAGLEQSMSRKGNCLDNAAMESFFGTLKSEYFYREKFESIEQLRAGIDDYIRYYNHERIKMKLGGLSPVAYRAQAA